MEKRIYPVTVFVALTILAGCDDQVQNTAQAAPTASAPNCVTTGPHSPIVTGTDSVVVVNGKTFTPEQATNCEPASQGIATHGAGSPIVTGAGAKVIITVDR